MPINKPVWVQRSRGLGEFGLWVVMHGEPAALQTQPVTEWQVAAERTMARFAEVATLSIVTPGMAGERSLGIGEAIQAATALLPLTFFSGRTADLLGLRDADDQSRCSTAQFGGWVAAATLKGLVHAWLVVDPALFSEAGFAAPEPGDAPDAGRFSRPDFAVGTGHRRAGVSVGIDAAWLSSAESGAQVAAVEMVRELATRHEIEKVVLLSDGGAVSRFFDGITKVSGLSWQAALAQGTPVVDILHRPYQPDLSLDYRRYHQVADCVALTVLDLIAYDNPAYHESEWSWRRYQELFNENVCLADCVFAISRHVAARLEHQFAHQLSGPVRPIPLGTDHLSRHVTEEIGAPDSDLQSLEGTPFLLVLGNDFEHKNRDFAVRVFADMRDRGYTGRLVLAGYHLDGGSTYGHELSGAGRHAAEIVRIGSVSPVAKRWLLRHAEVVLYPTSSEGFGLVPFEAAALDTPTAFVAFGSLREMLPGVDACAGWQVRAFADHVFRLALSPAAQVSQIQEAGAPLTWASHADLVLDGYRHLLTAGASWRTRNRSMPGLAMQLQRTVAEYRYRIQGKLRRLIKRES